MKYKVFYYLFYRFHGCEYNCTSTTNRSQIHNADAVLFHYADMRIGDIPSYRLEHQIWIMYSHESPANMERDSSEFNHMFNWTMGYRSDSTFYEPYMYVARANKTKSRRHIDFRKKTKFAFAAVSNKFAYSKRYRILNALKKMNPAIDLYGDDYEMKCEFPRATSTVCLSDTNANKYKFMFALENSNCKDYVTEKFWNLRKTDVIPVVHWLPGQKPDNIPKHSYINIDDFQTLHKLNEYLLNVGENSTLYNSYFEWKRHYDLTENGLCKFCKALHTYSVRQSVNLEAWLHADICTPTSVSSNRRRGVIRI